jgi:transposase
LDQAEVGIVIVISLRHGFLGFPLHSGLKFFASGSFGCRWRNAIHSKPQAAKRSKNPWKSFLD